MPELPEVETIVRGLRPLLASRRIASVLVREPRLRAGIAPDFVARLTGRRVESFGRHGKFMLAGLDDGRVWILHLGMTGRLTLASPERAARPHDHVVVRLDDASWLTFNDPRRFGFMAVVDGDDVARTAGSGLDALDPALTAETMHAMTRSRTTSIKAFLMDQRRIAGLGNIYVSEVLFRAGVRPRRRAGKLTRAESARIAAAIHEVLGEAIAHGGSSISDYRDGFDRAGSYQQRHLVYDRAGEPCVRCGRPIRGIVVVGRSTFYCARCQA